MAEKLSLEKIKEYAAWYNERMKKHYKDLHMYSKVDDKFVIVDRFVAFIERKELRSERREEEE